ncbi:hypothetical protein HID58_059442, partial [Brassica napus]
DMPLKSIARCSVSKRWAFVLRRPDFTELFFTRSLARTLLLLARIKEEEVIFFSTPQPQNLGIGNMTWRLIECDVPHSYPGTKSICINGVLYYNARDSNGDDMVVRFDVRSEKYSFVNFIERRMLPVTLINFQGKLASVRLSSLPPMWKGAHAREHCYFDGVTATNEFVFSPFFPSKPLHVYYYNFVKKTVTKVEIQGMGAFERRRSRVDIFLNHVADVKLM